MTVVVVTVGALATVAAMLRWLRVCQREHYIAGSCLKFAGRWIRVHKPNVCLVAVGVVVLSVGLWTWASKWIGTASLAAFALAGCIAVFPWAMSVMGEPRLRFTRRLVRLLALSAVLCCVIAMLFAFALGWALATALTAALVPVVIDIAAALLAPLEKRLLLSFRRRAESRLSEVSPLVIAITGSWGKTSTKQHVHHFLSGDAAVLASPASFNNEAGLSRTINEHLNESAEVFIAEMGMYKPDEIRQMCSWIRPDIAVITAIGPMHLERVGSIESIAAAKAEILERAETAVLWVDDPHLSALADSCGVGQVWRVGGSGGDRLDVEVKEANEEIIVSLGEAEVGRCPSTSGVHLSNVGCAVAAAVAYGIPLERLGTKIATLQSPEHRAVVKTSPEGIVVIDDTFNSNPIGAVAALRMLCQSVKGRRVVVTPGMVELGAEQYRSNADLAVSISEAGATLVVVGLTNRRALLEGARCSGGAAVTVRNRTEARLWVRENLGVGDGVLWENDLPDHYP